MKEMNNLKNEKGSITLFVLFSSLFFLAILASVSIFLKTKETSIEKQYAQIKENYETISENSLTTKLKPTEIDESVTFANSFYRVDVVWLDTNNNVIEEPNVPFMKNGMAKVTWDNATQEDALAQAEWYNYAASTDKNDNNQSKWANIRDNNGNYFVWIPRYAYRILYYENQQSWINGGEPTGYNDGYGIWSANGKLKSSLERNIQTVEDNGIKYIIPSAFVDESKKGYINGGWDYELSGFWVGKYETSRSDATNSLEGTSNIYSIKPGVQSATDIIGEQYTAARNFAIGFSSHMAKNSEWDAVAYLAHSQYGRNGYEITLNDSTTTGNGNSQSYNTVQGAKASTTGNIYGVYDMAGGKGENVSDYIESQTTYSNWSNLNEIVKNEQGNYISTKNITKRNVTGGPFFSRTGLFTENSHNGGNTNSFRIVLCP